jgi:hypothetical protein
MKFLTKYWFIFLFFQFSSAFSQDCNRIDSVFLFESKNIDYKLIEGGLLSEITVTISANSEYYEDFAWRIVESIDTINEKINLELLFDQQHFCYEYSIRIRNMYWVIVNKHDSVLINGDYSNNTDTLDSSIRQFITNPNDKSDLPQKKEIFINYFDTITITNHEFILNGMMIPDSAGLCSSWTKLNRLIDIVLAGYMALRNELAQKTWTTSYSDLDFDKRVSISKYYPFNIFIFPHVEPVKPPPPPPNWMSEEYKLDSIKNFYNKKSIKEILDKD